MPDQEKIRHSPRGMSKGIYILPNLFTTASLFFGFLSVVLAFRGMYGEGLPAARSFELAAACILFSALMDGLDGKVARLTGTASQFGIEYDSLADVVAFGLAPACLAWSWHLHNFGRLGMAVSFMFLVCAALRLARFNVSAGVSSKKFFIGLPSPASGITLATFVFFVPLLPESVMDKMPVATLILSFFVPLLMVTKVRYFSFKEFGFLRAHPFNSLVVAILVFILIFSLPRLMGFSLCLVYILSGIIYSFLILPRRNRQILRHLSGS